jgi:hypothetical protein
VWGGFGEEPAELDTGARYYAEPDVWEPVTQDGAPEGRGGHSAVAVGRKMIVWGGQVAGAYTTTGAVYDAEAALGEVAGDSGECTCPVPIGGEER